MQRSMNILEEIIANLYEVKSLKRTKHYLVFIAFGRPFTQFGLIILFWVNIRLFVLLRWMNYNFQME